MEKKAITLDMLKASFKTGNKDFTENPVFHLACILSKFSIDGLKSDFKYCFGSHLLEEDLKLLLDNSSESYDDGYFFLEEYYRVILFKKKLIDQNNFLSLVQKLKLRNDGDQFQKMLHAYIEGNAPALTNQSVDQLAITLKISNWLKDTSIQIPNEDDINDHLAKEALLEPFRLLTNNFQGREAELMRIDKYVNSKRENNLAGVLPLLISGIGGIGKSALIAKFILEQFRQKGQNYMPCIYIDFDKPGLSIAEPLKLASEGLHQLSIQFPRTKLSEICTDIKRDIYTYLNPGKSATLNSQSTVSMRGIVYESISRQYLNEYESTLKTLRYPVLVVMDSFEEAQHRASFSEIHNLFNFLNEVARFIPQIRFILIGRDDLVGPNYKMVRFSLDELDQKASEGYLASKGIKNHKLCKTMVQQLGGNPLSLKLAANFVLKISPSEINNNDDFANIFAGIDRERIQEQLFRRNLLHVNDSEVKKIAFPGMLVRRITPEIIEKVLAKPCGLSSIDINNVTEIFNNLQKEDFLISRESYAIVFRKDLRVALYDLIIKEYGEKVDQIHNLAVEYYQSKLNEPRYKAEFLYHRLKRGDSPDIIDDIYTFELRPYIESALTELPLGAQIKLASVMGITVSTDVVKSARPKEWEAYMINQIQDTIEHGDESGLHQMKTHLATRTERIGDNNLYYYEAKVHLRLGEFAKAQKIIDQILLKESSELLAMLLKAQIYEYNLQFGKAYKCLNEFDIQNVKNILPSHLIQYFIALLRNGKRDGRSIDNIWDKHKDMLISIFFNMINIKSNNDIIQNLDLFQGALPLAYRPFTSNFFPSQYEIFSINKLDSSIRELWENFLTAADFKNLYNKTLNLSKDKLWLEQKLFNQFKFSINNISEPAILKINIVDTLIFLEQKLRGDKNIIGRSFLSDEKESISLPYSDDPTDNLESVDYLLENKEPLYELISKGKINDALNILMNQFKKNDSDKNDLYLVMSRFNQMEKEIQNGMISKSDYNMERNRITQALLIIIEKV